MNSKFVTRQTDLKLPTYRLEEMVQEIKGCKAYGFDFETTGLDPYILEPVLLGIIANGQKYVIDFTTYDPAFVGMLLEQIIYDGTWIAHNAQFDAMVLLQHLKIDIDNVTFWDTMVSAQVLYNGTDLTYGYADLVESHFKEVLSKEQRQHFINRDMSIPIKLEEIEYVEGDLHYLPMLYERHTRLLIAKDMLDLCLEIEMPLIPVLTHMYVDGVNINTTKWMQNAQKYIDQRDKALYELKQTAGLVAQVADLSDMVKNKARKDKEAGMLSLFDNAQMYSNRVIIEKFNANSSQQVMFMLNKMNVFVKSTGADVIQKKLTEYEEGVPRTFMERLLVVRKKEKLVSTYGTTFLRHLNSITGRLHSSITQTFTDTGRLSSREPNVQNIPKDPEIRECFIPDTEDHIFVDNDFSGQELRIAAAYSGDEILLKNFSEGLDLHSYLAQGSYRMIKADPNFIVSKEVNEDLRDGHKPVLFGHIYGAKGDRHAEVLNITKKLGDKITEWLLRAMPGLARYQTLVKRNVVREGKMTDGSRYNRRKSFRTWKKIIPSDSEIETQGCNFPIQSTAATMSKEAMIKTHYYIKNNGLRQRGGAIKLVVHDEIVFQLHKDDIHHAPILKGIMEEVGTSYLLGKLPMQSSMKIANYWKK